MLRKPPTAVTLTATDVESFKKLLAPKQEPDKIVEQEKDDIFHGAPLTKEHEIKSRLECYAAIGRFGHSAILLNDSIYFYGGDGAINVNDNGTHYLSDLAILPLHSSFSLTNPPWSPVSGPQASLGGPSVDAHIAFMGGLNGGNMIIMGGVMPNQMILDEEPKAYSYDIDLGRWNSFTLPKGNRLNRQGAGCTATENGLTFIWGGKRTARVPSRVTNIPANIYRFDSVHSENSSFLPLTINPPSRYGHTQTLVDGYKIVVLGGFDGQTGDAISLADIWIFDTRIFNWTQVSAELDRDGIPANRSSHSQVLMPDGYSILIYGGYDGYHVYNDVAVLDTHTWKWTVKNTNAAVQGRADHTATLIGTNMVVAFGFTAVSNTLTVMSDIEVLDINTWSWTSVYTPASLIDEISEKKPKDDTSSSPSIAIIAGAVTGGVVVFILVLVAFYLLNLHQRNKRHSRTTSTTSFQTTSTSKYNTNPINDSSKPTRSDTIGTSTTLVANDSSSPATLLPSPWKEKSEWSHSQRVIYKPDDKDIKVEDIMHIEDEDQDEDKFDRQEFILLSFETCPEVEQN
ncbi:hypothetical protein G6F46_002569 [Rhizopus delemar]|uniref:Galactose oxidase n=2 Tax=Rhizopus TaxID=4842 RepID=A0A9P6ZBE0_9FUNG|nr:hypothetical protein G6F55_001728 [Rhizopus delemar]KAG1550034.1 hypothetical protein G6F51_002696 [Rhizopus arrhizus]KAG1503018.1 hypothetical protein G6F54_001959 [Rhizopus delemar]KAG1516502.1 hypothetical protein G6F53_002109 [Rhizopus delemar]KAG1528480.1 hypothetical protein G6F52_000610 [Rhizopus delemar]